MGKSSGFRLDLGEPWNSKLADFCAAHYNASQTEVIRHALDAFIDAKLEVEPEVKKRYEAAELKRRNLKYEDLATKLTAAGHPENARNLTNKIARGTFTAGFLLECLHVIGCTNVRIDDLALSVESG